MTDSQKTDQELLSSFIESGQQASFTELVYRHESLVMGVCYRILENRQDAQDAAQSTFIQLATKARKLKSAGTIAPWLYTVARQKALDSLKARTRRTNRLQKEKERIMNENRPSVKLTSDEVELSQTIDAAVGELPKLYRDVIVLHYLQENNY